jgi:hypothetical protein
MAKIEFRGQTYNNEFEMPYDVRQAYKREKERQAEKDKSSSKPLTEIVDMSPEVKQSMSGPWERWKINSQLLDKRRICRKQRISTANPLRTI